MYSGPSTTVARPKSPSFSDLVPSGYSHTSRFSGLTSLWTMLMLCRYFRAPARLYTMMEASLSVYLAEEVMASNRSPPLTSSITR